jgi:hypothetical protein
MQPLEICIDTLLLYHINMGYPGCKEINMTFFLAPSHVSRAGILPIALLLAALLLAACGGGEAAAPTAEPEPEATEAAAPAADGEPAVLAVESAEASSSWSETYSPELAFDDSTEGWDGWYTETMEPGEWIELTLAEAATVEQLRIYTRESDDSAHIAEATLVFADDSEQQIELAEETGWQDVTLEPVDTETVRIVIDSIHEHEDISFDSIALTEIEVLGTPAAE